jgi:hypothetical protein
MGDIAQGRALPVQAARQGDVVQRRESGDRRMTEPIQATEVPTPKPKLPRRWVLVTDDPWNETYSTSPAYVTEREAELARKSDQTLYALPASDEPAKPIVSAIPTFEEMRQAFDRARTASDGIAAIHALVSSRVVTLGGPPMHSEPLPNPTNSWERALKEMPRASKPYPPLDPKMLKPDGFVADPPPSLDPIKAIVEILELTICQTNLTLGEHKELLAYKLAALKRSLEPGPEKRIANLRKWAASHEPIEHEADDSREGIY